LSTLEGARASTELWFVAPRKVELRAGRVQAPRGAAFVARAIASGVSQGTELLLYRGEGPTPFDPSLDGPKTQTYPRRYGYAWVGEVVERGEGSGFAVGDRVFSLAPHGDRHLLDDAAARPIPESVPATRAVLAANLETAVTCAWDAGAELGDEVVVLGGGVVGLLTAWLVARTARRVRIVEPAPHRRQIARALGFGARDVASPEELEPDGRADVVIEATGDPRALDAAIAWAAPEAAVTIASFYGARTAPVRLGDAFHRRRLSLRSSQVSSVPARKRPRWDAARRFALVQELLEDAALDALIDEPVPFGEASRLYAELDAGAPPRMQAVFAYPG
jgi:2-desacetyl-2-hydroxyethyl bacteriochlorophyllide A dehydrogenase